MEGGGGEGGERKILRLGMWPSKALGSPWKRPNEGLYQYGFLKGRKGRGLGSEWGVITDECRRLSQGGHLSEQGVTSLQCGQALSPI